MPISVSGKPRTRTARGKPKILVTMGDPAGIGPEIIIKSLASPKIKRLAIFLIIGDEFVLNKVKNILGINLALNVTNNAKDIKEDAINLYDFKNVPQKDFMFGRLSKTYGKASIEYLERAICIIKKHKEFALVTAPINKEAINRANFHYGGHTEFLAKATKTSKFAMMLIGGPLRIALVTRHIPVKDISRHINEKKILETIGLTHKFLAKYLNKKYPKIAVASLNPHCGEGGVLGDEEEKIIRPAVKRAKKRYRNLYGPVAPDAIFHDAYKGKVDGIVSMYHDQGLIPLKMIARDIGVNVTLGLPFIRTSPDHGTAFDIAGKGIANPSSIMEAIKVAATLAKMKC